MNNVFKWFLGLFKNSEKKENKNLKPKTVGVIMVDKSKIKNDTIILNKEVYCVINVITDDNKIISFDYHLDKKLLTIFSKGKKFNSIKIEYIIVKK